MITDEEVEVYDRQIRLWGVQAQQKIRAADVLVVGLTGLATEVIKNLVLTGINSITLIDDQLVTEFDMLSNLFTRHQVGKYRAEACQSFVQELNPMVKVNLKNVSITQMLENQEAEVFIKSFHVVVLVNHNLPNALKLNAVCRKFDIPFFFACAWGVLSMVFNDLGSDFNGMQFVTLEHALKEKNISLRKHKASKRDLRKIPYFQSFFATSLTLLKFHEKNGTFPEILDEKEETLVLEKLKKVEHETVFDLNSNATKSQQEWFTLKDDWYSKIYGQLSFVSSIVGGFLSQEIIRSITKDSIDYNLFFFYETEGHNLTIGL